VPTSRKITMEPSPQPNNAMLDWLGSCDLPTIARITGDLTSIRAKWLDSKDRKWVHLDGACMADWPSTYSILILAFALPDYFGRNLDALSECLTDNDVLGGSGFVIHIENPSLALREANPDALEGLLDTFANAAKELGQPVSVGQPWDRPAVPLHVLLGPDSGDPRLQSYPPTPDAARSPTEKGERSRLQQERSNGESSSA